MSFQTTNLGDGSLDADHKPQTSPRRALTPSPEATSAGHLAIILPDLSLGIYKYIYTYTNSY